MDWERILKKWWWLIAFLLVDGCLVMWWRGGDVSPPPIAPPVRPEALAAPAEPPPPFAPPLLQIGFPTAQTNLTDTTSEAVFMPTASGRVESALYGSVRTSRMGPSFHEGIDIAPLERDRRGRALDRVLAIADGRVAYVNRLTGNSNYGNYVVLEHQDPVGPIYSLYAHLSAVDKRLREGLDVKRGETLGVLGNTPSSIIPVVRSHLHLELGMLRNRRFATWARQQKIDNRHGNFNGWNLSGISPLALYTNTAPLRAFSMLAHLRELPPAFELLIAVDKPLDYFTRYPALWQGDRPPTAGKIVLRVSEGGVIQQGRRPTAEEAALMDSSQAPVVLSAQSAQLGRNGLRLVVERNGRYVPGNSLQKWLAILTH